MDERSQLRTLLIALAVALAFALAIVMMARAHHRSELEVGTSRRPVVFVLSRQHGAALTNEQRQSLASSLTRESGLAVEVRVAGSALDGIDAFSHAADVGLLDLFEYVLAHEEYGTEARLQVLREGNSDTYAGELLVRAESSFKNVVDLQGKRFAYVDPFSTSGFVFPAKLLADAGVKVVPEFASTHAEALMHLRDGRVDGSAVYAGSASSDPTIRVLARTESIPNEPIFFRRDLSVEKRARLVGALESFARTLTGKEILKTMAGVTGFRAIDDAHFASVRVAIRAAGKTVYDVVPDGIRVESKRRGVDYVP